MSSLSEGTLSIGVRWLRLRAWPRIQIHPLAAQAEGADLGAARRKEPGV